MGRKSRYECEQTSRAYAKWKVGVYIRLSREDEGTKDSSSQSVLSQRKIIDKFLSGCPEIEVQDYYIDDGFTGTNLDRPAFQRLQSAWEDGLVNCIIIKDLSRLARNSEEASKLIYVVFPFFKIRFISVLDNVDSYADPQSVENIIIPVKNIIHDEYSRDLSKKVKSACDIRRKNGEFLGAFAPYGYMKSADDIHKLVVDEEVARIIRYIFDEFVKGVNRSQIAKALTKQAIPRPIDYKKSKGVNLYLVSHNVNISSWNSTSVTTILTSPVYIGTIVQGKNRKISYKSTKRHQVDEKLWIVTENAHEAIVTKEVFEKAQELLDENHTPRPPMQSSSLFAGVIYCGRCRRHLSASQNRGDSRYRAYYCNTAYQSDGIFCTKDRYKISWLTDIVLTTLNRYIALCVDMDKTIANINKRKMANRCVSVQLPLLQQESVTLKKEKQDLYFMYKNGDLSVEDYKDRKLACELRIKRNEDAINLQQSENSEYGLYSTNNNTFIQNFKSLRRFKKLDQNIIKKFIKAIYVYSKDRIEIQLNFIDEFEAALEFVKTNSLVPPVNVAVG